MSFLPPNQQRQSTEGNEREHIKAFKYVPYVKKVDRGQRRFPVTLMTQMRVIDHSVLVQY